jgi:hypothetical protein
MLPPYVSTADVLDDAAPPVPSNIFFADADSDSPTKKNDENSANEPTQKATVSKPSPPSYNSQHSTTCSADNGNNAVARPPQHVPQVDGSNGVSCNAVAVPDLLTHKLGPVAKALIFPSDTGIATLMTQALATRKTVYIRFSTTKRGICHCLGHVLSADDLGWVVQFEYSIVTPTVASRSLFQWRFSRTGSRIIACAVSGPPSPRAGTIRDYIDSLLSTGRTLPPIARSTALTPTTELTPLGPQRLPPAPIPSQTRSPLGPLPVPPAMNRPAHPKPADLAAAAKPVEPVQTPIVRLPAPDVSVRDSPQSVVSGSSASVGAAEAPTSSAVLNAARRAIENEADDASSDDDDTPLSMAAITSSASNAATNGRARIPAVENPVAGKADAAAAVAVAAAAIPAPEAVAPMLPAPRGMSDADAMAEISRLRDLKSCVSVTLAHDDSDHDPDSRRSARRRHVTHYGRINDDLAISCYATAPGDGSRINHDLPIRIVMPYPGQVVLAVLPVKGPKLRKVGTPTQSDAGLCAGQWGTSPCRQRCVADGGVFCAAHSITPVTKRVTMAEKLDGTASLLKHMSPSAVAAYRTLRPGDCASCTIVNADGDVDEFVVVVRGCPSSRHSLVTCTARGDADRVFPLPRGRDFLTALINMGPAPAITIATPPTAVATPAVAAPPATGALPAAVPAPKLKAAVPAGTQPKPKVAAPKVTLKALAAAGQARRDEFLPAGLVRKYNTLNIGDMLYAEYEKGSDSSRAVSCTLIIHERAVDKYSKHGAIYTTLEAGGVSGDVEGVLSTPFPPAGTRLVAMTVTETARAPDIRLRTAEDILAVIPPPAPGGDPPDVGGGGGGDGGGAGGDGAAAPPPAPFGPSPRSLPALAAMKGGDLKLLTIRNDRKENLLESAHHTDTRAGHRAMIRTLQDMPPEFASLPLAEAITQTLVQKSKGTWGPSEKSYAKTTCDHWFGTAGGALARISYYCLAPSSLTGAMEPPQDINLRALSV